jgi:hypothetical protein
VLGAPAFLKQPYETPFHFTLDEVFIHVYPFEDISVDTPEKCGHVSVSPQLSASRAERSIRAALPFGALVGELVHRCIEAVPSLQDSYIRHHHLPFASEGAVYHHEILSLDLAATLGTVRNLFAVTHTRFVLIEEHLLVLPSYPPELAPQLVLLLA